MAVFNTSTADGRNRCSNATYATARSGGGTFATDTTATFTEVGQELFGGVYYCYEAYWDFDTSSIPSGATITSVTLEGYCTSVTTSSSSAAVVNVRVYDWGATVTSADWIAGASVSAQTLVAHSVAIGSLTTSAYNTFTDDALAANINKGGITRFILTTDRFEAGTAPTGAPNGGEYASFDTAEGNDPKLTVTWTTSALGGNASGTGASYVAGPTVKAGALIASAVATVSQGEGSDLLLEVPNAATATGAAYTGTPKPQPSAGVGTATGIAYQIPLGAAIGNAAATGSALTTGATVKPAAGAGSATGAASSAVPSLSPSAGLASPVAFGAAYQPTVDRATYAVAGVASATGGASGASETVKPSAGQATATQTTYGPGVVSDSATVVASGAALAQAEAVAVFATIGATTGYGSGSGAALDATVTTGITVSAESALATAAALVARAGSFTGPSQGSGPRGRSPHHRPHVVIR